MKLRWKVTIGIIGAGAICAAVFLRPENSARTALEETRRALRQQGFKIDLAEFNLSASGSFQDRSDALLAAGDPRVSRNPRYYPYYPNLMTPAGESAVLVAWKEELKDPYSGEEVLPSLRDWLGSNQAALDAAREAALSGPIRFNLNALAGGAMLLPHLARMRDLSQTLATCALVDLHDGNTEAAWTNLLAATRLASAWEVEPAEVSHLAHFACATIVYDLTWEALQAHIWSDDRLAQLQREWESVDFFKGLAETAAFSRASSTAACQQERRTPLPAVSVSPRFLVQSPGSALNELAYRWRQIRYRNTGSYEDEKKTSALLSGPGT